MSDKAGIRDARDVEQVVELLAEHKRLVETHHELRWHTPQPPEVTLVVPKNGEGCAPRTFALPLFVLDGIRVELARRIAAIELLLARNYLLTGLPAYDSGEIFQNDHAQEQRRARSSS